ncbi:hypothetical protein OS493_028128 [Desmophyllum pertusum]|uniref:Uncharacterized protein n=1 Tax=Desmophyllum pertusum TaxID=174260 RepID=A0A9W9Z9Y2_9CNID|nr:hypothetical protein OS493_028128 [Desmophyllum pertusum]
MCGVAKPQRRIQTCPPQVERFSRRNLEPIHTEPSISHHKYSLVINSELSQSQALHASSTCKSRDPQVTLRDVVNAKSACICPDKTRFIGIRDARERDEGLEPTEDFPHINERMYSRKWLQDRIPTKIPDFAGCRKLT